MYALRKEFGGKRKSTNSIEHLSRAEEIPNFRLDRIEHCGLTEATIGKF